MLLKLKNDAIYAQKCYELSWIVQILFIILQEKVIEPDDIRKGFMGIHLIIQERKLKKVY